MDRISFFTSTKKNIDGFLEKVEGETLQALYSLVLLSQWLQASFKRPPRQGLQLDRVTQNP